MPGPYGPYVTLDELPPLPGDNIQLSDLLLARRLSNDYRFTGAILKAFIQSTMDEIYPVDFEIGSVTTLAAGLPATVELVEIDPARFRLNYGVPTGPTGSPAPKQIYNQASAPVAIPGYSLLWFKSGVSADPDDRDLILVE